jgi:hypothetical protein
MSKKIPAVMMATDQTKKGAGRKYVCLKCDEERWTSWRHAHDHFPTHCNETDNSGIPDFLIDTDVTRKGSGRAYYCPRCDEIRWTAWGQAHAHGEYCDATDSS